LQGPILPKNIEEGDKLDGSIDTFTVIGGKSYIVHRYVCKEKLALQVVNDLYDILNNNIEYNLRMMTNESTRLLTYNIGNDTTSLEVKFLVEHRYIPSVRKWIYNVVTFLPIEDTIPYYLLGNIPKEEQDSLYLSYYIGNRYNAGNLLGSFDYHWGLPTCITLGEPFYDKFRTMPGYRFMQITFNDSDEEANKQQGAEVEKFIQDTIDTLSKIFEYNSIMIHKQYMLSEKQIVGPDENGQYIKVILTRNFYYNTYANEVNVLFSIKLPVEPGDPDCRVHHLLVDKDKKFKIYTGQNTEFTIEPTSGVIDNNRTTNNYRKISFLMRYMDRGAINFNVQDGKHTFDKAELDTNDLKRKIRTTIEGIYNYNRHVLEEER